MKLSFLLILTTCLQVSASLYSQDVKLDVAVNETPIKDVLKIIESKSSFRFFYSDDFRVLNNSVSFNLQNSSLEKLLSVLLYKTNATFKIFENNIVVISPYSLQQQKVTGTITDASSGEPIIGANVVIEGTTQGTVTDVDGKFSIDIPGENTTLIISFLGYNTERINYAGQSTLTVQMVPDIKSLEEVVVIGYGVQKKVNLTGAVTAVNGEEMARRQVAQTSVALQGIAPGVVVTQRNGQPGADEGTISVRGKTTLKGDNSALILVDGVEMNLNGIDPNMIESISVLKDAASASIYGSRAANGVILVTTKRGKKDKISVSYDAYVGWQKPTNLPDMVGAIDHMLLTNEAYTNIGSSPLYSEAYIQEYKDNMKTNPDKYPDTDWYDLLLTGSGFMQNHFLTMSGGTQKARVIASLGYLDQAGIMPNTNFSRYTIRVNSDLEISKSLSAQVDAHIKQAITKVPSRGTGDAIHWAGRIPANQAARLSGGQWGEGWNGDNPVAFTNDGGVKRTEAPSATFNLMLKYKPTSWLYMDVAYSPNYYQSNNSTYNKKVQTYSWNGNLSYASPQKSSLTVDHNRYLKNNLRSTVNVEKTAGSHYFKLLAGYQQEDYREDGLKGYREIFNFEDYDYLNSGGEENQKSYGGASEWALQSFFGRLNYSFRDRYLFEANYRYDGSSRFAKGHRWGGFPSFSAGWRISEEDFFESLKNQISNLKIRASWGQLGNQNIGTYPSSSVVNLAPSYIFNNTVTNGAGITNLANTEISWETTTASNLGVDMTLFGKLNFVAEYYYKVTKDILLELDVPKIIGLNAPYQNAGKVENRGWDLGVSYSNWEGEFKYEVGFNISDVKNKVLDLKGISETSITANREGYEMYSIYGLEADGYISSKDYDANGKYLHAKQFGNFAPGDIKYIDQNNDSIIDVNDYKVLGGTIPRFTYGLSVNTSYKNVDFSFLIQGVGKANGLIYNQGIMPFYEGGTVQEQHKDRWTPDNQNATFPRLAFNQTNNTKISSFWMKDASYMRLKNIQLGYSIPKNVISKARIESLRIYVSGQNLLTLDNFWDGYDVEAAVGTGGYYPQQKTYCIGLDVKF
jgi:TonB-linked SusC/RagA family outer membrane protein